MPLHRVDPKASLKADAARQSEKISAPTTSASELSARHLPRHRMPEKSVTPSVAYSLVRDEPLLDGNSRQNLATFCTTWVSPEVRQLMSDCIDKSMIDKAEFLLS
jgi:glutamate/tyrosine decarboxylase-like PLP-dependent enzyme